MKYICSLLALSIAAAACNAGGNTVHTDSGTIQKTDSARLALSPMGVYTGDFGGSSIYISINFARGKNIAGYNTHKGLRRNLHGEMIPDGNGWKLRLEEPGDHPYDGVFDITLSEDMKTMKGKWSPLQKDSASPKQFNLKKIGDDQGEVFMANDSANISFLIDGSCKLEYYPTDSISSGQMEIMRGTWSRQKDTFLVNWQNKDPQGKRTGRFVMHASPNEDGYDEDSLTGDGFTFYYMP